MNRYPDYQRAVRLAYRTLLHLKINQLPVDIVSICRKCKNTIIIPFSKADPFAAMLGIDLQFDAPSEMAFTYRIEPKDGPIIHLLLYNDEPYQNASRFRFTLAHELGHIVMKHRDSGYVEEAEANCFAQHLLCPEPLAVVMREKIVSDWFWALAFGVSATTARIIMSEQNRAFHVGAMEYKSLREAFGVEVDNPSGLLLGSFKKMLDARSL